MRWRRRQAARREAAVADLDGPVVVRTRDRMRQPLGRFLGVLAKATGRPVTEIAREAQISRAYYYVLRDSDQTPSIETLANLLTSLGVDFRLGDRDDDAEFVVRADGDEWLVRLPYEGKRAARARAVRDMTYDSSLPSKPPTTEVPAPSPAAGAASAAGAGTAKLPGGGSGAPPLYALAPPPAPMISSTDSAGGARTFVVGRGPTRRPRSARENRLLSELVSAAGELDAARLEHLIVTARLLAEKPD